MKTLATTSVLILGAASVFYAATVAGNAPTPPSATKILDLFDRLRNAQSPDAPADERHVAFKLTETEVNDYMRYALKTTPRPGLESVTIKFFPKEYISTFTKVDFDAVERWKPGTIPAVLKPFLKGKKTILIDCRIHAEGSNLTFTVEKTRYEDMALPSFFVEKMIQIVAARQPEKYDTSKPIPLPFGLVKLSVSDHLIQGNN
jgi:hypothetical protein